MDYTFLEHRQPGSRASTERLAYLRAGLAPSILAQRVEQIKADGKHEKVVQLPGRVANPRRLQLWESSSSNKTLFDVCLRASDREVACNSLLLAEESAFFTAKFSNPDFGGSTRLVELQDVDGDTLETVVTALLTATIKLTRDNIERFLHCADMLQLSAVKDACCQFMMDCLDEGSAAATLSLAAKYSCDSLQMSTQEYIAAKFHSMKPDALKECTRAVFADLVSRDDLSLYTELQVLTAITVWCDHNGAKAFMQLLPAVRIENMSAYELHNMQQHVLVSKHPAALAQIDETLAAIYTPNLPPGHITPGFRRPRGMNSKAPTCSREAAFVRGPRAPLAVGQGRLVARTGAAEEPRPAAEEPAAAAGAQATAELMAAAHAAVARRAPAAAAGHAAAAGGGEPDEAEDAAGQPGRRVVRRRVAYRR